MEVGYVDVIRYLGVLITLAGTTALAPDATRHIAVNIAVNVARRYQRVRLAISRILGWPRGHAVGADLHLRWGYASLAETANIEAEAEVTPATGTVDQRIDALHRKVLEVERRQSEVLDAVNQEREDRATAVAKVQSRADDAVMAITSRLNIERKRALEIDYHGVYVLFLGTLLAGAPEVVAAWPRWVGVLLLFFAVSVAYHGWATALFEVEAPPGSGAQ